MTRLLPKQRSFLRCLTCLSMTLNTHLMCIDLLAFLQATTMMIWTLNQPSKSFSINLTAPAKWFRMKDFRCNSHIKPRLAGLFCSRGAFLVLPDCCSLCSSLQSVAPMFDCNFRARRLYLRARIDRLYTFGRFLATTSYFIISRVPVAFSLRLPEDFNLQNSSLTKFMR